MSTLLRRCQRANSAANLPEDSSDHFSPGWMESYLAAEVNIMRDDEAARRHSGRLQRQRRP